MQLEEARAAHKTCYDELMQSEDTLRGLRHAHTELAAKHEEAVKRLAQLSDANRALDEQLALAQERHRVCQKELQTRDVACTKLRVDLDAAHAKCQALCDEVVPVELSSLPLTVALKR